MEQIYKILEEIRPEFDFKESNDYIEDGLLDSFDIEAAFGILIDGLDIIPENFQNITTICEVVKKNGGEI